MAGFFNRLFGTKPAAKKLRTLSHPRSLEVGDIIKIGYNKQVGLSGQEFQVFKANSYVYDGISYPEFILKDRSDNIVFLMIEEEDGEECLAFSKKLTRSQIADLISEDVMNSIFKKGTGLKVAIANKPHDLEGWFVNHYVKTEDNVKGAFVKDAANESFTSYLLTDKSDEYALEIEKYASNEVEISVTAYHEISAIEEMWPKN